MKNIYVELTREINAAETIAVLASGQAVVWHRVAIMSKDGDWILRETETACARVIECLGRRSARYRAGAPLDVRWLSGGWSSHFEFRDREARRIRCDFVSRPPRLSGEDLAGVFREAAPGDLAVIGIEPLIRIKRTQRQKDYAVIAELSRRLPPDREIRLTTDVDRILELAPSHGEGVERPAVAAARAEAGRDAVVVAVARETDAMRRADRARLERYVEAARPYLRAVKALDLDLLTLPAAHRELVQLATRMLPQAPPGSQEES